MSHPEVTTSWGPQRLGDGRTRFSLWAPNEPSLSLVCEAGDLPMERSEGGWFVIDTDAVAYGGGYGFRLPDGFVAPDPAAHAQMGDVHGLSKLVDHDAYAWRTDWRGRPWEETIIYEMHVGTFTPEGTLRSAIDKLPHIAELGATAVELMPLAQFGGNRGWGYDGVLLYAVHNAYGSPDDLKAFVDAAHALNLMVFLDVVYNHFGPDGNYLGRYAKTFFHNKRHTPWGAAIAYDEPAVRSFFIDNPLHWLARYRLDGLRFDAIDNIVDHSDEHILVAMAKTIRTTFDRPMHLHTEDERNIVGLHQYRNGRPQLFTAEWNDDYHNVIHPIATGDNQGYYLDFAHDHWNKLARSLAEGFIFQGEASQNHGNRPRGVNSKAQPPIAFVNFNQNHDQVGNRAFGERLIDLAEHDVVVALTAVLLLAPQIPLLFMGEEYGETRPFTFFTDFRGDLAHAVRQGRRNEFKKFDAFTNERLREEIPDPNDPATFAASKLGWERVDQPAGAAWLSLYRTLLQVRHREIVPRLAGIGGHAGTVARVDEGIVDVNWRLADGATLSMAINLTDADAGEGPQGQLLAAVARGSLADEVHRGPHSTVVTLVDA